MREAEFTLTRSRTISGKTRGRVLAARLSKWMGRKAARISRRVNLLLIESSYRQPSRRVSTLMSRQRSLSARQSPFRPTLLNASRTRQNKLTGEAWGVHRSLTQNHASFQVLDEVMGLCSRPDGNDGKIKYRDFARLMWDDEVHEQLQDKPRPFKIGAKSEMHPVRHLFLPLRSAGFYNDNVQPRATVFGVNLALPRYSLVCTIPRASHIMIVVHTMTRR
jgi:hypothetical protein